MRNYFSIAKRIKNKFLKICRKIFYSLPSFSQYDLTRRQIKIKDYCSYLDSDQFKQSLVDQNPDTFNANVYAVTSKSEIISREIPKSLSQEQLLKFKESIEFYQYNYKEFVIPESYIACINNARIYGEDFIVLSQDNYLFLESYHSHFPILEGSGALSCLILPDIEKFLIGSFIVLGMPWHQGYYHWIIDILPRLSLIEKFSTLGNTKLIVPSSLNSFQKESLLLTGVSPTRIQEFDGNYWQVEKLYFPSLLSECGNPSPSIVSWLREKFLCNCDDSSARKKIYISRSDTNIRRILNEDEIASFLSKEGFEIICPGSLSFEKQVEIFKNANVIVAPHGAGLTNIVFSPRGSWIIELFPEDYINGCYWALANVCKQNYSFMICNSDSNYNLNVSLANLIALLSKVPL